MRRLLLAAVVPVALLLVAALWVISDNREHPASSHAGKAGQSAHPTPKPSTVAVKVDPLRSGETRRTLQLATPYTPKAPAGVGTDDYHCFLLDPKVTADTALTGFDIRPDNLDVVHHVILFRVPAKKVAAAEAKDRSTPGDGWTCFGNAGLDDRPGGDLNDAPWLGAWAPGGGERRYQKGFGMPLEKGSRIVVQIHYNLLKGASPDQSSVVLRTTKPGRATKRLIPLTTMLLPAPVELPCRAENRGPLCQRSKALAEVKMRFGGRAGATADLLYYLCGGKPKAGTEQSCTRTLGKSLTVRAVSGHMHLLGTSIKIDASRKGGPWQTLLDIPVWDFDNQGSKPIKPFRLDAFDKVRVTCHHAQWLRDQQPSFEKQRQDRYVVWGEGSTDEMCLGILMVSKR